MHTANLIRSLLCLLIAATSWITLAGETGTLDPNLEPFRPYLGKTWRGAFKQGVADKPLEDVAKWERALNGKAVRITHSVGGGAYGGETFVVWNAETKELTYHYFTTAGFYTVGTMTITDGKIISHETVKGRAGGVTEVKATFELRSDQSLVSKAQYLKNGKWEPGREVTYKEDPAAEVKFK